MGELAERVFDQIEDLPQEAMDFTAPKTGLSIGKLVVHLAWAECQWIRRVTGEETPAELSTLLQAGKLETIYEPLPTSRSALELITLCRRVQREVTLPSLSPLEKPNAEISIQRGQLPKTVIGVLMHLLWHWTYHSAHIGLIRLQWGSDYVWTQEKDPEAS